MKERERKNNALLHTMIQSLHNKMKHVKKTAKTKQ